MPKLNIGDKVKIVNVRNCEYGYNSVMLKLTGKITVITNIYDICHDYIEYKITADNGRFTWSSNCFEPIGRVVIKNE